MSLSALRQPPTLASSFRRPSPWILIATSCLAICLAAPPCLCQAQTAGLPLQFEDVTTQAGLLPAVGGIQGHAAGWGDIDGDGWLDLYVATFHTGGSKPNMLFRNREGQFVLDQQPEVEISTRATGALMADLDNDGDLDLYVASMPAEAGSSLAERSGHVLRDCTLFRNEGEGKFTNVSEGNGACPRAFGGRSATVLDYDGDGLLDLLVGSDPFKGYNGSQSKSSRLFRNLGNLQFKDVSRDVGLPEEIPGLGVAAGDVNNDGWPDFFLASNEGGNRLFLNNTKGGFREAPGSQEVFAWSHAKGDDMVCGVHIIDVNRDGRQDIVLGQHFSRPWIEPVANRLYLNQGIQNGVPRYEDVTERVGLVPLPMKGPHVEFQDFNNDGWFDLYTSIVKFVDGRPVPVIFLHQGLTPQGLPKFKEHTLGLNDFPNEEDRAITRSGTFFDKMIADRKIIYSAPGPSADFDNDGRIDVFLANWWIESPSMLLRNTSEVGNWLQVSVRGTSPVNRSGIGSRVNVYEAGKLGQADALLGSREIAQGYGYASAQAAMAHFGLAARESVDVEVVLPHGKGRLTQTDVTANQRITIE